MYFKHVQKGYGPLYKVNCHVIVYDPFVILPNMTGNGYYTISFLFSIGSDEFSLLLYYFLLTKNYPYNT